MRRLRFSPCFSQRASVAGLAATSLSHHAGQEEAPWTNNACLHTVLSGCGRDRGRTTMTVHESDCGRTGGCSCGSRSMECFVRQHGPWYPVQAAPACALQLLPTGMPLCCEMRVYAGAPQ